MDEGEYIREQMMRRRHALIDKLESLEHQVSDSVHGATEAVHDTMETVKGAVHDTIDTLKQSVSIKRQVRKHPWGMMGAGVGLGFLGGRVMMANERQPARKPAEPPWPGHTEAHYAVRPSPPEGTREQPSAPMPTRVRQPAKDNWLTRLGDRFAPEIDKVKGLAIGTTFALIRDMVMPAVPSPLAPQVREVLESVTTKLGGKPIRQPLIHEEAEYTEAPF
jgi:hypothetical protein